MTSLGEGVSPLVELPRLADELGVRSLHAKLESCSPTGSYKDRVAARSMELAIEQGARGWITTSSGNGGTAFAAYGRRAGLPGVLCVTQSITREKLLPALALGARVVRVAGLGDGGDCKDECHVFEIVQAAAARDGLYLGITTHRHNAPGMRAAEDIAREVVAAGRAPDVAYVPTGGGGLVAAIARGFRDAGVSTAVVAAQPAGCAPIARHLQGALATPEVAGNASAISGLQLPGPPDGELAAERVRQSGGWGVTAEDSEILDAQRALCLEEGVFVEPAAACALAGLVTDLRSERIGNDASVLLVLTGSGLKDLASIERAVQPPPLVTIDGLAGLLAEWSG